MGLFQSFARSHILTFYVRDKPLHDSYHERMEGKKPNGVEGRGGVS
jgi:hypothetical protein